MNGDIEVLEFESRLTIATRGGGIFGGGCECAPYFIQRSSVLIPEVVKEADKHGIDALDLFAAYARGVHRRHETGLSLAVTS